MSGGGQWDIPLKEITFLIVDKDVLLVVIRKDFINFEAQIRHRVDKMVLLGVPSSVSLNLVHFQR